MIIDIHVHLAGAGHGQTGCYLSPRKLRSPLFKLLKHKLGISRDERHGRLDQGYLERLTRDVDAAVSSQTLDAIVAFAHDHVYLDAGTPLVHQEVFVPNEYVFKCCAQSEGRMLPAMSVHPYRSDAVEQTARWIDAGAVAMKWLPDSQNIDPSDKRCRAIYKLLAGNSVPLISHTGGEHTVTVRRADFENPECLKPALEAGVTVIAAHCATKSGIFGPNWLPQFCQMARAHPNFWGDTSALITPGRARWIRRLISEEGVVEKLVHGSDYPIPPAPWWALFRLGIRQAAALSKIWSWLERDVKIKRACGMPEAVFTNAAKLLRLRRAGK